MLPNCPWAISDAPEVPQGRLGHSQGSPGPFQMLLRHTGPFQTLPRFLRAILDTPKAPPGHFRCSRGSPGRFRCFLGASAVHFCCSRDTLWPFEMLPRHPRLLWTSPEAPPGHFRSCQGTHRPFQKLTRHPRPFRTLSRHSQAILDAPEAPPGSF